MNAPTVELLLRQAVVLLRNADAMNAAGDYSTFALQRQARETLAAALDIAEVSHAPPCPDCGSTDWGHATPCGNRTVEPGPYRTAVKPGVQS